MINKVPTEILTQIKDLLSRNDICKLASTCKHMYNACLPTLYHHLILGYHTHMRQLLAGVATRPLLQQSILSHTKKLTLVSRQNGNHWRVYHLLQILGPFSNITMLIFRNFDKLSTNTMQQIVSILPHLQHIQFEYCHLVSMPKKKSIISSHHYTRGPHNRSASCDKSNNQHLQEMSFIWTDFMKKAAATFLFPRTTRLSLGSNRNKFDGANGAFVKSLYWHCPNITHLTITLPQVADHILCGTISQYGQQLRYLSIWCDSSRVISTIAHCASHLEQLTLRLDIGSTAVAASMEGEEEEKDTGSSLVQVIENCTRLTKLEVVSFDLDNDVPHLIWESILASSNQQKEEQNIAKMMVRAQEALINRSRKEEQDQKGSSVLNRRPTTRRSIWFYTVSEEALAQRHYYNSSIGLYQQQLNKNNLETLVLDQKELSEVRSRHTIL